MLNAHEEEDDDVNDEHGNGDDDEANDVAGERLRSFLRNSRAFSDTKSLFDKFLFNFDTS